MTSSDMLYYIDCGTFHRLDLAAGLLEQDHSFAEDMSFILPLALQPHIDQACKVSHEDAVIIQ